MQERLKRTALMLGEQAMNRLALAKVAVLGLGGVGGMAAEALCRAGVMNIMLVDSDTVSESNLNRQIIATSKTLGQSKTEAAYERLLSIAPDISLTTKNEFFLPENSSFLFSWQPDIVLDAIDTVTAKLFLAERCAALDVPLISCLGAGNRLDPTKLRFGDINDTKGTGCPLARVMRRELKKRGVGSLSVVYSVEEPQKISAEAENGRHPPASIAFVPPAAGLILAAEAVKAILKK